MGTYQSSNHLFMGTGQSVNHLFMGTYQSINHLFTGLVNLSITCRQTKLRSSGARNGWPEERSESRTFCIASSAFPPCSDPWVSLITPCFLQYCDVCVCACVCDSVVYFSVTHILNGLFPERRQCQLQYCDLCVRVCACVCACVCVTQLYISQWLT